MRFLLAGQESGPGGSKAECSGVQYFSKSNLQFEASKNKIGKESLACYHCLIHSSALSSMISS